jgi:RNA polymerase sigma factor for flagellar operon FliA
MNAEETFLNSLPFIEQTARSVSRRHGLSADDSDDFESWVKLRLIEHDYAVFRKFRGESSLNTYLAVIVAAFFREYGAANWGRWRPSATATRLGPLAVRLEALMYREHHTLAQAIEVLRSSDPALPDERELTRLASRLPPRPRVQREPLEAIAEMAEASRATGESWPSDDEAYLQAALERTLNALAPEDALIVRMRFFEGNSIADVARTLQLEQKAVYRRAERILHTLRDRLENEGVDRARVVEFLSAALDA